MGCPEIVPDRIAKKNNKNIFFIGIFFRETIHPGKSFVILIFRMRNIQLLKMAIYHNIPYYLKNIYINL